MKVKIIDDYLADNGIGHDVPIGTICEGWYEDDGLLYVPVKGGSIVLLLGEYEILEDQQ